MGNSPADGVIDKDQRLFGYSDFFVIDGSSVPTNLGVNPSLTITALAEHAMAQIPDKVGAALPAKVRLS
jgi:cholesterol oxidase